MSVDIKKIIDLRLKLHRIAELSGQEFKTSELIEKSISKYNPDKILKIAETGRAFVFDSNKEGKTIMFRAELDALAISESKEFRNHSLIEGNSHKCGHDGHMAILVGLAEEISKNRPKNGKVILLFQPSEETLTGALKVLDSKEFKEIEPDYIFAIHNLPNFEENSIIIRDGNFTSATNGITVYFIGTSAHPSSPTNGNDPTAASIELLNYFNNDLMKEKYKNFVLSTPVYTRIGTADFNLTPCDSEIKVTLRTYDYSDLDKMIGFVQEKVKQIAKKYNLKYKIQYTDDAAPIYNNQYAVEQFINAAKENDLKIIRKAEPFKWTDDFGYYTIKYKGALIGIGTGEGPHLHSYDYDFNDNIIYPAINLLNSIYKEQFGVEN